ncbi:ribonuclease H-like domain-containing protein [Tanacetum coccineum]
MRIRSRLLYSPTGTTLSAPQVLLAEASSRNQTGWNNHERDNRTTTREVCYNFRHGFCRWGDACRFLHDSSRSSGNPRNSNNSTTHRTTQGTLPMHAGSQSDGLNVSQQQQLLQLLQAQQTMLAQFGFKWLKTGQTSPQLHPSDPTSLQAMLLPQVFNTMTLRDPTDANWNMDIGASSHLNSNATNLSTLFNSCMYPSVLVGDGKSIPVTNTGHSTLPTPYRPLHLNNVLITPNIVKNLISVRQFVRDNKCTIEFDEFGFSVKDYWTRQILLRCDSTGDLYPVTSLSYPQAFLVGQQTWHQRLGHPGSEVLRHLVSNNLISCNKTKSTVLCHACQLGKHVRLPFSLSETVVKSPFDIIHSDLWTSPLSSVSGIKYYVLFLDHFSHYLWVYPLRNKSDALSKFIHFRAFVKNQFQCDIKSLQCDHGAADDDPVSDPTLYRSLAGALQYLTFTRPDISYAVQQVCLYMHDPSESLISLLSSGSCGIFLELHTPLSTATLVYYDNVSAVYLSSNLVQHQCTKHIEIDIHFVRDLVAAGHIRVLHVPSRYQYADVFTKGLPTVLFDEFCSSLSVRSSAPLKCGDFSNIL